MKKKPLNHPNAVYIGKDRMGTEWWSYKGTQEEVQHLKRELRRINRKTK